MSYMILWTFGYLTTLFGSQTVECHGDLGEGGNVVVDLAAQESSLYNDKNLLP